MSMFKAGALALMIPLAMAAPALAQDGRGPGPQMLFSEMDLNGDGAVTLEEMREAREGRFARADADGDGLLSREEMLAHATERAAAGIDRMIERMDADGNGLLSEEEIADARDARRAARLERMFDRVDADGDGQVSEAEFEEAMQRLAERRGGHRGEDGQRGHGHGFWRG